MSGKFGIFQTRKATKETPFDETFGITRRAHVMYMISGLTYLLVAWLLQQNVWMGQQVGFIDLPPATYLALLAAAGVITVIVTAALLFYLPKITAPAAVLSRKSPRTQEAFGFELYQAHIMRIIAAQTPAILGLVLFLLNGSIPHMLIFVIVSWMLLLLTFPRKEAWEEAKMLFEKQQLMRR